MGSIELVGNTKYLLSVLNTPEMLERISEGEPEEMTEGQVEVMKSKGWVLGWRVDDDIKGFYWVHPLTKTILQIHAHFPVENRQFAKHSGEAMLAWVRANTPDNFRKLIAMIPICYPDVIGFSEREGLAKESILSKSSLKNGKLVDIQIMGAER